LLFEFVGLFMAQTIVDDLRDVCLASAQSINIAPSGERDTLEFAAAGDEPDAGADAAGVSSAPAECLSRPGNYRTKRATSRTIATGSSSGRRARRHGTANSRYDIADE
jgi:hypothetical protein